MTSLPHDLQNAEWNGRRRKLVIKELHPDRGPGELPVKLFAVMNFLKRRKRYILLGYLMQAFFKLELINKLVQVKEGESILPGYQI